MLRANVTFPNKAIINTVRRYFVSFIAPISSPFTLKEGSVLGLFLSFLIFGLEPIIIAWVLTTFHSFISFQMFKEGSPSAMLTFKGPST